MFVTRIEATGFGGLPNLNLALDRVTPLDGPPRALATVGDALALALSAWDARQLRLLLTRWGCEGIETGAADLPDGAHWTRAPGLAGVLEGGPDTPLTVTLTITLDPPLYGRLRKEAARDPRLVDALADGAVLSLKVGARFNRELDAMALDVLAFEVGGVSFAVGGADRPAWMSPFLRLLRGRLQRGPVPPGRWAELAGSYVATEQRSLRQAVAALAGLPARVGDVVVTPEGPAVLSGDAVVPVALFGDRVVREVGIVGAVFLSGAEVLVLEDAPRGWSRWLSAQALEPGSPLEQVILLGERGGARIG